MSQLFNRESVTGDLRGEDRGWRGFSAVELMVSVAILALITTTASINITKVKMREELEASARQVASTLRNLQAQALAAKMVKVCTPSSVVIVCELGTGKCGGSSCAATAVPMAVGMTIANGASSFSTFAEADASLEDRRQDSGGRESTSYVSLATGKAGTSAVTVTSLMAGSTSLTSASIAFERQNGNLRIEACGGVPPLTPACAVGGEPLTLRITLTHAKLAQSLTVAMNRLTGKISIE
jgi:prepilin-type N-terminal cleavage/methylation domain-containing protein